MKVTEFIERFDPCSDAVVWLESNNFKDMNQAWNKCERDDWMMWTLREINYQDKNTLINLACDFAERVLPIFERAYPNDTRPRNAIQVARDVVAGKKTRQDAATYAATYAATHAAYATHATYAERKWQAKQIRKYIKNPF